MRTVRTGQRVLTRLTWVSVRRRHIEVGQVVQHVVDEGDRPRGAVAEHRRGRESHLDLEEPSSVSSRMMCWASLRSAQPIALFLDYQADDNACKCREPHKYGYKKFELNCVHESEIQDENCAQCCN